MIIRCAFLSINHLFVSQMFFLACLFIAFGLLLIPFTHLTPLMACFRLSSIVYGHLWPKNYTCFTRYFCFLPVSSVFHSFLTAHRHAQSHSRSSPTLRPPLIRS
jgi:hypothetical protein